jgi:hypothetical protein
LSRIIQLDGVGKQRKKMSKEVVLAIRELMRQDEVNDLTKDLAAFITLRLMSIYDTIDLTVAAWEKRGYWVKADRFRLDWAWSGELAQDLNEAIHKDDWQQVAVTAARAGEKLNQVQVSERHRLGEPWLGAWDKFSSTK